MSAIDLGWAIRTEDGSKGENRRFRLQRWPVASDIKQYLFRYSFFIFNIFPFIVVIIKEMTYKRTLLRILIFFYSILIISSQSIEHEVQRGDTLYSLSRKYDISIDKIMDENGLSSPEQLRSGIILQIPKINLDYNENNWYIESSEYFVKKGDTLYSIARRNGLSVSFLLEINNLSDDHILSVGERLLLNKGDNSRIEVPKPDPETVPKLPVLNVTWPTDGDIFKMDGKLEGIKILADSYSYVRSIASGKVVLAEPYRGFGNVILIDVDGYIYLYGGNEDIFVNVGEEVAAGTRIGRLGMSDNGNGKEDMFFSVFKDGKPVDTSTAPRG